MLPVSESFHRMHVVPNPVFIDRDGELDIVVGTIVVTVHVLGRQRPDVDPDRVYIYGMSMGGIGAFEMPDFMEWMFSKSKKKILN